MRKPSKRFTFQISLSVLDHLGRNLYRNFATVIGEAISNAWDADANNVFLYVDKKRGILVIKDDGIGMNAYDFRNKFLKIGFSKRKAGIKESPKGRPYIGRKGIGKLALLSCADRITVISKKLGGQYVGGTIDNNGLDRAITNDLTPQKYRLEDWSRKPLAQFTVGHKRGTIIYLEGFKGGISHTPRYLKKIIALYFRFSLIDSDFQVFVQDQRVTLRDLGVLTRSTQFIWSINDTKDPFVKKLLSATLEDRSVEMTGSARGFIASVEKPANLKIPGTEERVTVDLYVNGRVRERDILKHIPTARVAENYFYGQIHLDELDDDVDRFTSSREGIIADDPKFRSFLDTLRKEVLKMIEDWDVWRRKHKGDGDPDNPSISRKQRKSEELYNAIAKEYELPKGDASRKKVGAWVDDLADDASFNFQSYAECFISENLIRTYIREKKLPLSKEAIPEAKKWRQTELDSKNVGNVSIRIRRVDDDLSFLDMDHLANLADKGEGKLEARLARDAKEYKPMRNAIAHTALLTNVAKGRLTSVFENIKARVITLLGTQ